MRKILLSLLTLLTLSASAQEKIRIDWKRSYQISEIDKIEVINAPKDVTSVMEACGCYSIFTEALEKTGLADTLCVWQTGKRFDIIDTGGYTLYTPTTSVKNFTVFALDDNTLKTLGITSFSSLKRKCVEWYGNVSQWYTSPKISTGDDYTYTYNVVNIFLRYHILRAGIPASKLVNERNARNNYDWNFAFGGEPYNYFETMLPHSMIKVWQPLYHNTGASTNVWINRYRANNTLTDEYWSFGSDAMHKLVDEGALINKDKSDIAALNGYIHNISKPLVFDKQVVNGVLNERMRVDFEDMLPELANNGIRALSEEECAALNQEQNKVSEGMYCYVPSVTDYFEGLKRSGNFLTRVCSQGQWRSWSSRELIVENIESEEYVDIKLPPVPYDGEYEIRLPYPPMLKGFVMKAYIDGKAVGEPVDLKCPFVEEDWKAIGYQRVEEFTDYGVESDKVLRRNGYMRSPASFSRGGNNSIKSPASSPDDLISSTRSSCRYEEGYGTIILRRIIGPVYLTQGVNHWLRIKNIGEDVGMLMLDYIEIVPKSVYANSTYTEDWY